MRAKIIGTGSFLPEKIATNDYLSTIVETDDAWIKSRTGIEQRHIASSETTVSMAAEAARNALRDAGIAPGDLELIIVATVSPDHLVPSTACMVQKELNALNAAAFDINAACSGFLFALNTADSFFQAGMYHNALLIGVESLSKIIDWTDRTTCVLFGDGAGAAVVQASDEGLLACTQGSDGTGGHFLICENRTNNNPYIQTATSLDYLKMDGQEVFKFAVRKVPECIFTVLNMVGLKPADIDCYILHQANYRIIQSIAKKLELPPDLFPSNLNRYGNTSAASIPVLLDETNKAGRFKKGDMILLAGFGAGLTWGSAILKW